MDSKQNLYEFRLNLEVGDIIFVKDTMPSKIAVRLNGNDGYLEDMSGQYLVNEITPDGMKLVDGMGEIFIRINDFGMIMCDIITGSGTSKNLAILSPLVLKTKYAKNVVFMIIVSVVVLAVCILLLKRFEFLFLISSLLGFLIGTNVSTNRHLYDLRCHALLPKAWRPKT